MRSRKGMAGRHGGTLLEVLVSLIVLSLLLQVVVEVASQQRTSRRLVEQSGEGMEAAMRWMDARRMGEGWASGEEGHLPQLEALRWRLVAAQGSAADGVEGPDAQWRVLEIRKADDPLFAWRMTLRLRDEREAQEEQGAEDWLAQGVQ